MSRQTQKRLAWLFLGLFGLMIYLSESSRLTPLLSKLSLNFTRAEPQWWEGTWRPSSDETVPWLQLSGGRTTVTGQFVTEAKAKGFHQSVAIQGGESRPPDALLFNTESMQLRNNESTSFYLLIRRSETTAELYRLTSVPPGGELHLDRPGNGATGPVIYFPSEPQAHQRIAVLTKGKPAATFPVPATVSQEVRRE